MLPRENDPYITRKQLQYGNRLCYATELALLFQCESLNNCARGVNNLYTRYRRHKIMTRTHKRIRNGTHKKTWRVVFIFFC